MVDGLSTQNEIDAFAYDPKDPKTMFVGLKEGIFLSKNENRQWSLLKQSPKGVRALLFDPKGSGKIFAGTKDGRIYISNDRGRIWRLKNR
jgi:ligand-binding sensor domain-containing protein